MVNINVISLLLLMLSQWRPHLAHSHTEPMDGCWLGCCSPLNASLTDIASTSEHGNPSLDAPSHSPMSRPSSLPGPVTLATSTGAGTTCTVAAFVVTTVPCTTTFTGTLVAPRLTHTSTWLAPAGTVTEAGTESTAGLELLSFTGIPPGGAAAVRNTVTSFDIPIVSVGLDHTIAISTGAGTTCTVAAFV